MVLVILKFAVVDKYSVRNKFPTGETDTEFNPCKSCQLYQTNKFAQFPLLLLSHPETNFTVIFKQL